MPRLLQLSHRGIRLRRSRLRNEGRLNLRRALCSARRQPQQLRGTLNGTFSNIIESLVLSRPPRLFGSRASIDPSHKQGASDADDHPANPSSAGAIGSRPLNVLTSLSCKRVDSGMREHGPWTRLSTAGLRLIAAFWVGQPFAQPATTPATVRRISERVRSTLLRRSVE